MTWRYQPVWREGLAFRTYGICEVYFDETNHLESWTGTDYIAPQGDNIDDLTEDLALMLDDVVRWEPVDYNKMKVGDTFIKRPKEEQRKILQSLMDRLDE